VEINGRIFCRKCLAQLAGTPAPASPPPYAPSFRAPAPRGRYISGGILALLTIFLPIPGVNYMYEGLIKRGLAAMGGFFFLIYALIQFSFLPIGLIFALSIPVYWLACLFDAMRIRHQINAGVEVNDDIDDMITFVKSHKRLLIGIVLVLIAVSVVGAVFEALSGPLQTFLPFIIVGFGLYVLVGRPKRRDDNKPGE
jgi:hypothetical protein